MQVEVIICDRCRNEVKHATSLTAKAIGLDRELCNECIDSLKAFLVGKPDPNRETILEFETKELEDVYRRGAEALEAWATGATADQLAEHIRDMLSRAKRETNGAGAGGATHTILGVTVQQRR